MKFATVRELSSGTSQLLKEAEGDEAIVITKFGKPRYLLVGIDENEIEDFILARHYNLETAFEKAQREQKRGKTNALATLLSKVEERG